MRTQDTGARGGLEGLPGGVKGSLYSKLCEYPEARPAEVLVILGCYGVSLTNKVGIHHHAQIHVFHIH